MTRIQGCSVCWGSGVTMDKKPCPCGCMPLIVTKADNLIDQLRAENSALKAELAKAKDMPMKYKRMTFNAELQEQVAALERELSALRSQEPVTENTSDGYHTFKELYAFRKAYNAALFNTLSALGFCNVHKSWKHHDGEPCFGGGWFIVVAILPSGQVSNHYEADDWDLFCVQETPTALFEFDGHTGKDVIERLLTFTAPQPAAVPDGWKLVPVEPGARMMGEGVGAVGERLNLCMNDVAIIYNAMLSAAPEAPSQPSDDAKDAARYRYLRNADYWPDEIHDWINGTDGTDQAIFDAAIDAAMKESK